MDVISFSEAATANGRIESFIENPDSMSGIVTVPKVIASGETITIPAGRVAVLPNVQVDGVLNIQGEVFVPSGATTADLDNRIGLKADTTYVDAQVATRSRIVQGTVVNSTSGTSIDFTGIPSWAKKITVMFNGVSTSGASHYLIQCGYGTTQTTGYAGSGTYTGIGIGGTTSTAGFVVWNAAANESRSGTISIFNIGNNKYVASGIMGYETGGVYTSQTGGSVTLSGILDRVRITTANGTDTFDAGQINIMYEG